MKLLKLLLLLLSAIVLVACGGEEEGEEEGNEVSVVEKQGWHFQGRNCLGCHNVDFKPERHLLLAGTVFKTATAGNPDDMAQVCGGELYIQLLDSSYNIVYDSRNYRDPNSKGYRGKGNVFILKRLLSDITPYGGYYVRVITKDGTTLAQSLTQHLFNGISSYDPRGNPADANNRFSCNTCHAYPNPQGGAPGYLYPQFNANLCK